MMHMLQFWLSNCQDSPFVLICFDCTSIIQPWTLVFFPGLLPPPDLTSEKLFCNISNFWHLNSDFILKNLNLYETFMLKTVLSEQVSASCWSQNCKNAITTQETFMSVHNSVHTFHICLGSCVTLLAAC